MSLSDGQTVLVTGAAGFIGGNVLRGLNARGIRDIIAVDDLTDGTKFRNLADAEIADYWDQDELLSRVRGERAMPRVRAVLHQGACSDTTQWDGRFVMRVNYTYSRELLDYCAEQQIALIYASSASVYGGSNEFAEQPNNERPLNVYGYSKLLFDNYVRRARSTLRSQVVGLRYFNVYGPGEAHKAGMASVVYHFDRQLREMGTVRLFEGSHGYGPGEQRRDFVFVDDVVAANLWFLERPHLSGIFNLGSGVSRSFNDVARAVIAWHGRGDIEYIEFPTHLAGRYQAFTEADLSTLRRAGYETPAVSVEDGVRAYLDRVALQTARPSSR